MAQPRNFTARQKTKQKRSPTEKKGLLKTLGRQTQQYQEHQNEKEHSTTDYCAKVALLCRVKTLFDEVNRDEGQKS